MGKIFIAKIVSDPNKKFAWQAEEGCHIRIWIHGPMKEDFGREDDLWRDDGCGAGEETGVRILNCGGQWVRETSSARGGGVIGLRVRS